jgi:6-pyruvoyltetrahydropterin/6-carboxytetrahydropterin synthase
MTYPAIQKKYTSTKEYIDAFPVAYRQWRDDGKCSIIHGYALTIKFYFETDELDVRNWVQDYGGLRPLKAILEDWFDHRLLVAIDDPQRDLLMALHNAKIAKVTEVEKTGCEGLADYLYKYVNTIFLPSYGKCEADRLWCYRVEVRETQANMAFREGHREWNENLDE